MYELVLFNQIGPRHYVRFSTQRFDYLRAARAEVQGIIDTDHVDGARADRIRILDWSDCIVNEWVYGADDPDSDACWHPTR